MGNAVSNVQSKLNVGGDASPKLDELVRKIAANYITTINYTDMENLTDPAYCNELEQLTTEQFDKLDMSQLTKLYQTIHPSPLRKDKIVLVKSLTKPASPAPAPTDKQKLCHDMAQYYIKILRIYAAIAASINPSYVYTDASGNLATASLAQKPAETNVAVKETNFCNKLLNALNAVETKDDGSIVPVFDKTPGYCTPNTIGVAGQPGIPELENLYRDMVDESGKMVKSPDMQKKYAKDVQTFYKAYTKSEDVPENITSFDKIPVASYGTNQQVCTQNIQLKRTDVLNQDYLTKYAEALRAMMNNVNAKYQTLVTALTNLFDIRDDGTVTVKSLTQEAVDTIANETRQTILDMYTQCQQDFVAGVDLYEKLVMSRQLEQMTVMRKKEEAQMAAAANTDAPEPESQASELSLADTVAENIN